MRAFSIPLGQLGAAALLLATLLSPPLRANAAPIPKVGECTADAPEYGKQILTIRLTPSETRAVDAIVVDCVLCQTSQWTDGEGVPRKKTIGPVFSPWRQNDVKWAADLDCNLTLR